MTNDAEYARGLNQLTREKMRVRGKLADVISDLKAELGEQFCDLEYCKQAFSAGLIDPLKIARAKWLKFKEALLLRDRHHVLNGEAGGSCRAGTNILYQSIALKQTTLLKSAMPATVAELRTAMPATAPALPPATAAGADPALELLVEAALKEAVALETIAQATARGVNLAEAAEVTVAAWSFPLGLQDKPIAAEYQCAQKKQVRLASPPLSPPASPSPSLTITISLPSWPRRPLLRHPPPPPLPPSSPPPPPSPPHTTRRCVWRLWSSARSSARSRRALRRL